MVYFLVNAVVDTLPLLDGYAGYGIEVANHSGAGLGALFGRRWLVALGFTN